MATGDARFPLPSFETAAQARPPQNEGIVGVCGPKFLQDEAEGDERARKHVPSELHFIGAPCLFLL